MIAGLALLAALFWIFWRRRSRINKANATNPWEIGADEYMKPISHPREAHEMGTERVPELGGQEPIGELPANSVQYKPGQGHALVDERAAAGYDGAYRGN